MPCSKSWPENFLRSCSMIFLLLSPMTNGRLLQHGTATKLQELGGHRTERNSRAGIQEVSMSRGCVQCHGYTGFEHRHGSGIRLCH